MVLSLLVNNLVENISNEKLGECYLGKDLIMNELFDSFDENWRCVSVALTFSSLSCGRVFLFNVDKFHNFNNFDRFSGFVLMLCFENSITREKRYRLLDYSRGCGGLNNACLNIYSTAVVFSLFNPSEIQEYAGSKRFLKVLESSLNCNSGIFNRSVFTGERLGIFVPNAFKFFPANHDLIGSIIIDLLLLFDI